MLDPEYDTAKQDFDDVVSFGLTALFRKLKSVFSQSNNDKSELDSESASHGVNRHDFD